MTRDNFVVVFCLVTDAHTFDCMLNKWNAFDDQWEMKETCVYVYINIYKKVK